jgi:hypothetical protein
MAPPKSSGSGPKPMTANLQKTNSTLSSDAVSSQELSQQMASVYDAYTKFESNQKLKAENELKFNCMMDRLKNDQLAPQTL